MSDQCENSNFFSGYMKWDNIKVSYLIFHILMTVFGPFLLYSIAWYEKNGVDPTHR